MTTKERWKDDPERLKMVRKANKAYAKACRGLTPDEERQKWDEYSYKMLHAEPFGDNVCCKFHPDGCQKAMEAHYLKEAEKERKAWNERVRREQRSSWCFDDAASYVLRGVFAFLKVVVSIVLVTAVIVAIACPAAIVPMLIVGLLLYSIIFHPVQFLKAVLALFVLLASLFILVCVLSG